MTLLSPILYTKNKSFCDYSKLDTHFGIFRAGTSPERSVDTILKASIPKLREKLLESLQAVLPIVAIVLILCFSIAPVSPSILLCFLLGAAMIIVGIMFFTLGAEMSMSPMGERVGAVLTKSRSVPLIIGVGFLLGNTELRDAVNAELLKMAEDGTMLSIAEKYVDQGLVIDSLCLVQ